MLAEIRDLEARVLGGVGVADEGALRLAIARLAEGFLAHVAEEDSVLHPAIQVAFPTGRPTIEALRADHAELRLMLHTLTTLTRQLPSAGRDEQVQVVLRDFVDLLRLHVRREESAVFDVASRALSSEEATELERRISARPGQDPLPGDSPGASKGTPT